MRRGAHTRNENEQTKKKKKKHRMTIKSSRIFRIYTANWLLSCPFTIRTSVCSRTSHKTLDQNTVNG